MLASRLPNGYEGTTTQLFLIGAAKSGTTTLARLLGDHPDILLSDPKEPYFFELLYDNGLSHYRNHCFATWSGEPMLLDARHRNQYLPFVPARIAESAPNPLFLAVLREPITRAHSHWWHWRGRGVEALDFADAVRTDWERVQSGVDFTGPDGPRLWSLNYPELGDNYNARETLRWRTYVDSGFYDEQLRRYFECFGRDRLLVLFTDELRSEPERTARRVAEFVGVTGLGTVLPVENPAVVPLGVPSGSRSVALRSLARKVLRRGPSSRPQDRAGLPPSRPEVDGATAAFLARLYAPHNHRLQELLDRRLPASWDRD